MSSLSTFDCLAIGEGIQTVMGDFSPEELHIFGYLACLLSLYFRQPVSEWGYGFILSEEGVPFSYDIFQSFNQMCQLGYINSHSHYSRLSSSGKALLEQLKPLQQYNKRFPMIKGACESLLAIPLKVVRNAVTNVPEIKRANIVKSKARNLLMEANMGQFYDQFQVLSATFGVSISDLMIPATAWLSYLAHEG